MNRRERLFLYPLLAVALLGSLRGLAGFDSPARAGVDGAAAPSSGAPEPKIGVVALMKIADELMDSSRYKPARDELDEKLNKELLRPTVDQLKEIEAKVKEGGEAADTPENRQNYMRLRGELSAKQREMAQRAEELVSQQLKEVYGLIRTSAAAVAEKHGFNYVLSTMRPDDKFQNGPVLATIRDLLSRPVPVFPEGVDITEEVREDLKL